MRAAVLEKKGFIQLRDIELEESIGPDDVNIAIKRVGICGSDLHYYQHGRIGDFVVKEPMVLGHEASGVVVETGKNVNNLQVGDRVCMEPGIPDSNSREVLEGHYNLDPKVRFWATPPVHGCMRETVVHPGAFTFRLPEHVSLEEGAMVEPLAIGIHAARKARIAPGDTAVVIGAGTIGLMTALAAASSGCGKVYIIDINASRLAVAETIPKVIPLAIAGDNESDVIKTILDGTDGRGASILFEASGSGEASKHIPAYLAPGGRVVAIGMPPDGLFSIDIVASQVKELEIVTIFRYANIYPRAIAMLSSGSIGIKAFISKHFPFSETVEAFNYALAPPSGTVKCMIDL